jgi:hypothetical protein
MARYKIKISLVRNSFITLNIITFGFVAFLTLYLITIKLPIKQINRHHSIFKSEDQLRMYYNKSFTPNSNQNLLETLEVFYINYENVFDIKLALNRTHGLYRNGIYNIFQILMNQSVVSKPNHDLAFVDLGIEDSGLYALVAVSLGYQVVAASSDFCSFEILKQSIKNISKTLNSSTPLEKITFLNNEIRQVSCLKIPYVRKNCYSGKYSVKNYTDNKATHLAPIRLSDIVLSHSFKKIIFSVNLRSIEPLILFDDLNNIIVRRCEIPTIVLTSWNKV